MHCPKPKTKQQHASINRHRPIHRRGAGIHARRPKGKKDANDAIYNRNHINWDTGAAEFEGTPADGDVILLLGGSF